MDDQRLIRRRTLPSSLRHVAGKLTELADAGGAPDLRGHALTLLTLADETEQRAVSAAQPDSGSSKEKSA